MGNTLTIQCSHFLEYKYQNAGGEVQFFLVPMTMLKHPEIKIILNKIYTLLKSDCHRNKIFKKTSEQNRVDFGTSLQISTQLGINFKLYIPSNLFNSIKNKKLKYNELIDYIYNDILLQLNFSHITKEDIAELLLNNGQYLPLNNSVQNPIALDKHDQLLFIFLIDYDKNIFKNVLSQSLPLNCPISKKEKQNIFHELITNYSIISQNIKKSIHFEKIFLAKNICNHISIEDLKKFVDSSASSKELKSKFLTQKQDLSLKRVLMFLPLNLIKEIKEHFNIHIPII